MVNTPSGAEYYIGIMSGTSMDAIDAVLVQFSDSDVTTCHSLSTPFPADLRNALQRLITPDHLCSLQAISALHVTLGELYADVALSLIEQSGHQAEDIVAIGNHGQTVWHQPDLLPKYSWQLGDANQITEKTGITTVADFRNRDIAAGGQGAPLVPAFHEAVFSSESTHRVIVNIGGISNISVLVPDQPTCGFDTGPGNGLMDAWCQKHLGKPYDQNGEWANSGQCIPSLLNALLETPYFGRPPPKSTGKEYFNLEWLDPFLSRDMLACDIQATLLELTARSIHHGIDMVTSDINEVYICGGGARNGALLSRLSKLMQAATIAKTDVLGIDADWVEAIAFAWLARQTILGRSGNLPSATGAKGQRILGAIYPA